MSETMPTPGPWRTQGWVSTWAYIPVHDANHNLVASLYPNEGRGYTRADVEANARLVAAARGLLDAASAVLAVLDEQAAELSDAAIAFVPEAEALRAAITAAKGGAQ